MTTVEELARCGLEVSGDPPRVTVECAGQPVAVTVAASGVGLEIRAEVPLEVASSEGVLVAPTLTAPGDTTVEVARGSVRVVRHQVDPPLGALYDAVHEAAKQAVATSSVLEQMAGLGAAQPAGAPSPAAPAIPGGAPIPAAPAAPGPAAGGVPVGTSAPVATPSAQPDGGAGAAPPHPPVAPTPRWWGYVETPTQLISGDTRAPVATLQPGQWYAVLDEQGGWLQVDSGGGVVGWVGASQVRRG